MNEGQHSLAEVKQELGDKIDAVDRKVDAVKQELGDKIDAVDRKVDAVKQELVDKIDAVDCKVDAVDRKVDAVKQELVDKIDAVDRKVDAVDRKIDAVEQRLVDKIDEVNAKTRADLTHLINATATGLEHHLDKKLEQMEGRMMKVAETAGDSAAERVIRAVFERASYDAAVFDDKLRSIERRLEEHLEREHSPHAWSQAAVSRLHPTSESERERERNGTTKGTRN